MSAPVPFQYSLPRYWRETLGVLIWLLVVWFIGPLMIERATDLKQGFFPATRPPVVCNKSPAATDAEILQCYSEMPTPADTLTAAEKRAIFRQYGLAP